MFVPVKPAPPAEPGAPPGAATPPPAAARVPSHTPSAQLASSDRPPRGDPPPPIAHAAPPPRTPQHAAHMSPVLSWQAVQPNQVVSSPIRRLPDLPDLYRAMVSPYNPLLSPAPRGGVHALAPGLDLGPAGAAAAVVAAAAASAAVSASAAAAAAATAAAVARAEAARSAAAYGGGAGEGGCGAPAYNPLTSPLQPFELLPLPSALHGGAAAGDAAAAARARALWGLDPLQQLRATQTSLEATIAAAFGVPPFLTAVPLGMAAGPMGQSPALLVSGDWAGGGDSDLGSLGASGGVAVALADGLLPPDSPREVRERGGGGGAAQAEAGEAARGAWRRGSGGGASPGVVRALHSIFGVEDDARARGGAAEAAEDAATAPAQPAVSAAAKATQPGAKGQCKGTDVAASVPVAPPAEPSAPPAPPTAAASPAGPSAGAAAADRPTPPRSYALAAAAAARPADW